MAWRWRWSSRRKLFLASRHITFAESTADLFGGLFDEHPQELHDWAWMEIERLGYRIRHRPGITAYQRRFTTTWRRRVDLVAGWDEMPIAKRAETLVHELVHVRQRRRKGHVWFEVRYLPPRWRWALEIPAYREYLRARARLGANKASIEHTIEKRVRSIYTGYRLGRLDPEQYERETRRILGMDLGI